MKLPLFLAHDNINVLTISLGSKNADLHSNAVKSDPVGSMVLVFNYSLPNSGL